MNTFSVMQEALAQLTALEQSAARTGTLWYTSREDYNTESSEEARRVQREAESECLHHQNFLDACLVDIELALEGDGLGKLLRRAAQEGVDADEVLGTLRTLGLVAGAQYPVTAYRGNYSVNR